MLPGVVMVVDGRATRRAEARTVFMQYCTVLYCTRTYALAIVLIKKELEVKISLTLIQCYK